MRLRGMPRGEIQPGHRGDAGKRLTSESHGGNLLQVFERTDFAGGMSLQGQSEFCSRHPGTIIHHANQVFTALFQCHRDVERTGVQTVLHQFLDYRNRPFHHLPGGDLVDEMVGQDVDGHGCSIDRSELKNPEQNRGQSRVLAREPGSCEIQVVGISSSEPTRIKSLFSPLARRRLYTVVL